MADYSLGKYKRCIEWIIQNKEERKSWDEIKNCCVEESQKLDAFQKLKIPGMIVPLDMQYEEWVELVNFQQDKYIELSDSNVNGIYSHAGNVYYPIPSGNHDGWNRYVKLLKGELDGKPRMSQDSIDNLEEDCHWLLNRIRKDTREAGPQKGLVMGNVQSGKTAAMTGLITMAAHYDWNFIIVLSGTIDNLRVQTRDRFMHDLQRCQDVDWHFLESSTDEDFLKDITQNRFISLRETNLNFSEPHILTRNHYHETYVMVCLKQASRLKKLINWLHSDETFACRLRMIVIDDEADQASINTANMTDKEVFNRTQINKYVINLANGTDENGQKVKFQALNYLAFTATPYANVLNEAYKDSLFPKDFAMCLAENNSYIGGKVIWGSKRDEKFPGMNIVRTISPEAEKTIINISKGKYNIFPDEFKDSVAWFICCVAVLRERELWKKPISMLIHTSSGTKAHFYIYECLKNWINTDSKNGKLYERCRTVYERETRNFTYECFKESYENYEYLADVKCYPTFEEISDEISDILFAKTQNIVIDSSGDNQLEYSEKGMHICVDNCAARSYADGSDLQLRLIYPNASQLESMGAAPAFIVIGGNTLSRGLTIEGLVSTFFARNSNQADSLMQMARWYGYRRDYELLPRVWMTGANIEKYKLLEEIDEKLRRTLADYKKMGKNPGKIYPAIMSTSAISKFNLTAKNKSQNMIPCNMDFSGDSYEATEFFDDSSLLRQNINHTELFLKHLGEPERSKIYPDRSYVWRNIQADSVLSFLQNFSIFSPSNFSDQMRDFYEWMKKENENSHYLFWNVAVCGSSTRIGETWKIAGLNAQFGKVERTKKAKISEHIDIGSLRSGRDGICDIDNDVQVDSYLLEQGRAGKNIEFIRGKLGYSDTPLLLIYCIDKDGGSDSATKTHLGIDYDLVSYSIVIGGEVSSSDHVESVIVRAPEEDEDDIEE